MAASHHRTVTSALFWCAVGACSAILVGLVLATRHKKPQPVGQQTGYGTLYQQDLNPRAYRDILHALINAEQELR